MRYIGGKSLMIENIFSIIKERCLNIENVCDLFSGSGIVAKEMKKYGYQVDSNDLLYFSFCLNRGSLGLNEKPNFKRLNEIGIKNPIDYLNGLSIKDLSVSLEDCFVWKNYSKHKNCERMYLQEKNAIKIDIIRLMTESWKEEKLINDDEYFYLICSLLNAVPYVSNITGVYGAYLKKWDKRTYNDLVLIDNDIVNGVKRCCCYNKNAIDLAKEKTYDLVYIDPPYNERQYLPNYHLLETIAKYDYPNIKGKTGIRVYNETEKSGFCSKKSVCDSFNDLLSAINSKYVIISYNNQGLLNTNELIELCNKYAKKDTFKLYEYEYRKYKSNKGKEESVRDFVLKEQLYFFEKEKNDE